MGKVLPGRSPQALLIPSRVLCLALCCHGTALLLPQHHGPCRVLKATRGQHVGNEYARDLLCLFFIEVCSSWMVVSVTLAKAVAVEQYPW